MITRSRIRVVHDLNLAQMGSFGVRQGGAKSWIAWACSENAQVVTSFEWELRLVACEERQLNCSSARDQLTCESESADIAKKKAIYQGVHSAAINAEIA